MNKRGQSTMEMAMVTAVVVAALLGMQMYMKRGLSGYMRGTADAIGEQYSPKRMTGDVRVTSSGRTISETTLIKGAIDTVLTTTRIDPANPERTNRTGEEHVGAFEPTLWD